MNVFELISGSSIAVGAVAGTVWGFTNFGIVGGVLGLPVGAALGWCIVYAFPLMLIAGIATFVVWLKYGRREARLFLWGRGTEPPNDATSSAG